MNKIVLELSLLLLTVLSVVYLALGLPLPGKPLSSSTVSESPKTATQNEGRTYKLSEVTLHKSERDCWMAIDGSVYDVSDYATEHPGGRMDLLAGCGIDATELYTSGKAGRHHQRAVTILESYKIGVLSN